MTRAADSAIGFATNENRIRRRPRYFRATLPRARNSPLPEIRSSLAPEDAVANCFPGLELDIRNLDRRFFPGLVFNFVEPDGDQARLCNTAPSSHYSMYSKIPTCSSPRGDAASPVRSDGNLQERLLADSLRASSHRTTTRGVDLRNGNWYLDWIEQGETKRISTRRRADALTGLTVWRLIRGLEPGPVSIGLKRRDKAGARR